MINLLLLFLSISSWNTPTEVDVVTGYSTYYSKGLFAIVAENRNVNLKGYVGPVSLNRKGDLYRKVWLEWADGTVEGPFLNIDCAAEKHYRQRLNDGRVVEVPAWVAEARGFYGVGPALVRVWFKEPHIVDRRR